MSTTSLIDEIMTEMPESWDGDDPPESVVVAYVRELERRVKVLGGDLEKYAGISDARAKFVDAAAKHVTTEDVTDWNDMVDAWDAYARTVEAEK